MTREQIYWAIGLNISATIIWWLFLQSVSEWLRKKFFYWILSVSEYRRERFYLRVARRDTSYTTVINYFASTVFGLFSLSSLPALKFSYLLVLPAVMIFYSLTGYLLSFLNLSEVERMIQRYEFVKALVRPRVDELFLIALDSRFATITKQSDFDEILEALQNSPQTNPRSH